MIEPSVQHRRASDADYAWAVSVADSLPRDRWAEPAQNVVTRAAFFRGDTAAARDRSVSTLRARDRDWTRLTYPFRDELMFWVMRSGGLGDALVWARTLRSPASRAAALVGIGEAWDEIINWNNPRSTIPLHACRDEFQ